MVHLQTLGNGRNFSPPTELRRRDPEENIMHSIIYIVGLIVVVMAVLSFFGLR
jgi:hypothetical protein